MQPTAHRALSVSALNRQVKSLLEHSFLSIQVIGEISNLARPSSGHWYFTLKDSKAQVRCAMFRNSNQRTGFVPREGDEVLVTARVSLYEGRGDYQLICERMEKSGLGQLQQAFDALKAKLDKEGLFDSTRKRPLPPHPRHLGVVTSPSGAAIHDILTVLKRRFPGLPVTLYPTAVQGQEAAGQIVAAIDLANRHAQCDVLIVGRGGGSLEDLWPFNEEIVARAIAASAIPIVSAVGHEVDISISDLVADQRAATPSAAAELLSPDRHALLLRLNQLRRRLESRIGWQLERKRHQLQGARQRLRHPGERVREHMQALDRLELRLQRATQRLLEQRRNRLTELNARLQRVTPARRLEQYRHQLQQLQPLLSRLMQRHLERNRLRLAQQSGKLQSVSPLATLERGYSILLNPAGQAVSSAEQVSPGERLEARLHRGRLTCTVDSIEPGE
ncbi:exodeoxyribonuclease VII large subunit [Marinobacterium sp. D7]|uniref:exodeoxyribonuclease VII large subunit n=1 Tax=Marinobacterium ramblicola TaxID=2849041 RepID=UPI001C2CFB5B|nr:exodeoxyribonuclease VII large subunit [Marinobacterium ramblicola]MBV1787011.1 exodeoxyribonuclease VII large subunit [Marinobacterium ramblicola]